MENVASIENAEQQAAANLFVIVPEVTLPNGTVVPSFQVGQYISSQGDDGKVSVTAEGKPWVEINYQDSRAACASAGYKLLTELQALAIAHDIAQQPINWTGGAVGEGSLFQGLRNDTTPDDSAQPGTFVPEDSDERRWHELSNGARIYDFAGNCYSWVFDDVQGDADGIVSSAFSADSPSLTTAPYPSMQKGVGWLPSAGANWSGRALVRGGCWYSDDGAGVFRLDGDWPDVEYDFVGFRCTK